MSASILYHAFGLKGIHDESTHYPGDSIVIRARMTDRYVKSARSVEAEMSSTKGGNGDLFG